MREFEKMDMSTVQMYTLIQRNWPHRLYNTGYLLSIFSLLQLSLTVKSKLCSSMAKRVFFFFQIQLYFAHSMRLNWSSPVIQEDPSSEKLLCPHCVTPPQLCNCVPNHSKPRLRTLGQDFSCGSPEYIYLGNLLL